MTKVEIRPAPEVSLSTGDLRGTWHEGVATFRGVPFAAPPVGPLRFRPPQPPIGWKGIRAADRHGPIAPQSRSRLAHVLGDFSAPQSEDCLNLTVWTPECDGQRPVLVWIHGGAFVTGGSSLPCFDGTSFAKEHGLIVVSINYRLGPLGWLCFPGVSPGNLGLLDQIAALGWVQENIGAFGGNPSSVTVVGSSAGAVSIFCMLARREAKGLFQRAILQSGPYSMPMNPEHAERVGRSFLECAGLRPDDIQSAPAETLLEVQARLARASASLARPGLLVGPVIDGGVSANTIKAAVDGATNREIMLGFTRDEQNAFFVGDKDIVNASPSQVESVFQAYYGDKWTNVLDYCRQRVPDAGPRDLLSFMVSLCVYADPCVSIAQHLAASGREPWLYRFDWAAGGNPYGACHGIELPFVFNNCSTYIKSGAEMLAGATEKETARVAKEVQAIWAQFAATGNPNHSQLVRWPPYQSATKLALRIADSFHVEGGLAPSPFAS